MIFDPRQKFPFHPVFDLDKNCQLFAEWNFITIF